MTKAWLRQQIVEKLILGGFAGAILLIVTFYLGQVQQRNADLAEKSGTIVQYYEDEYQKAADFLKQAILTLHLWGIEPPDSVNNNAAAKEVFDPIIMGYKLHLIAIPPSKLQKKLQDCSEILDENFAADNISAYLNNSKKQLIIVSLEMCYRESVDLFGEFAVEQVQSIYDDDDAFRSAVTWISVFIIIIAVLTLILHSSLPENEEEDLKGKGPNEGL